MLCCNSSTIQFLFAAPHQSLLSMSGSMLPFVNNEESKIRLVDPSHPSPCSIFTGLCPTPFPCSLISSHSPFPSQEKSLLDDWAVPVLGRDHYRDGPHAAEIGASHLGCGGWWQWDAARRPLVILCCRDLVILGLEGVLMQVGGWHGAQGGALAANSEAACCRSTTLRRGHVLSDRKWRQQHVNTTRL